MHAIIGPVLVKQCLLAIVEKYSLDTSLLTPQNCLMRNNWITGMRIASRIEWTWDSQSDSSCLHWNQFECLKFSYSTTTTTTINGWDETFKLNLPFHVRIATTIDHNDVGGPAICFFPMCTDYTGSENLCPLPVMTTLYPPCSPTPSSWQYYPLGFHWVSTSKLLASMAHKYHFGIIKSSKWQMSMLIISDELLFDN